MSKCKNCIELSLKLQESEKQFNDLYRVFEANRKSHEEFSIFLSKLTNGKSLDKMEIIRQFKNYVSLKETNKIAKKFII